MTSNGHPIRRYALRWYNRLFTLKAQLTFILLGVSLLSGILCASLLSRSGSNILKKNAIAQNCMQMNQLAYNMNEQLKELEQCAYSLALNDSLQEVVSYRRIDNYSSQNAFSKSLVALDELAMRNTLAEALFVYMEDGLIIGRNAESNLFIR